MLIKKNRPSIRIKSSAELDGMRAAGRLAARCLETVLSEVAPGVTTRHLDDVVVAFAREHGARSATLGYRGYPASVCTSINEVICHGIPDARRVLQEGDTIGVDVTLIVDGFHGDNAATVPVGEVPSPIARLLRDTLTSLRLGIEAARPGAHLGDVGAAIQEHAEGRGWSVVRDFVGHGIGRSFHEEPQVAHVGRRGRGVRLRPGMTFTIEPMINEGTWRCHVLEDEWTAVTDDGKVSAQFEHTIAIGPEGPEILTVQNETGEWEPPGRCKLPDLS